VELVQRTLRKAVDRFIARLGGFAASRADGGGQAGMPASNPLQNSEGFRS
jgi:hypothetical protein